MSHAMQEVMDASRWNEAVQKLPGCHILQSWEWGEFKQRYGWLPHRYLWSAGTGDPQGAAQVLERRDPRLAAIRILYAPRAPLIHWQDAQVRREALTGLASLASQPGVAFVRADPAIDIPCPEGSAVDTEPSRSVLDDLQACGWRPAREQVQFRNTFVLSLETDPEGLLKHLHPKTRYNIRLAQRRGVSVRSGDERDFDMLHRLYAVTSVRDHFVIREADYYRHAWGDFLRAGMAQVFVAEVEGTPVAGLIAYRFGSTAWYLYGMSSNEHRERMPNYLLQWEAIQWARTQGCDTYDFWGAPDTLDPADPMSGLYRFKQGFGAQLRCTPGAWDVTRRPALYHAYHLLMPLALGLLRRRGLSTTERSLG
jgi:peptidoglycan pentaglycine glycine transferase (the first glycine)